MAKARTQAAAAAAALDRDNDDDDNTDPEYGTVGVVTRLPVLPLAGSVSAAALSCLGGIDARGKYLF